MTVYKECFLPVSDIRFEDETYQITTATCNQALVDSIREVGLINPPLVFRGKTATYTIISGFRRIAACRELNISRIAAKVVAPETNILDCVKLAIADNASHRSLNMVETSRALNLLSENFIDLQSMGETAQNLGLPGNPEIMTKIMIITRLPQTIQNGILENRISLKMAIALGHHEETVSALLMKIIRELELNRNKQKEVITYLVEIAAREGLSVSRILESPDIQSILSDGKLDNIQKTRKLRTHLRRKRYPHLFQTEEMFKRNLKQLKLGNNITLTPSNYFEATSYTLSMTFSNRAELKQRLQTIIRHIESPHLKAIFRI
jgi:ParB family chromosome partitioning protein